MIERAPGIFEVELHSGQLSISEIKIFIVKGTESGRSLMVDAGFRNRDCLRVMEGVLEELGIRYDQLDIFLTHKHHDHCGLASVYAERGGQAVHESPRKTGTAMTACIITTAMVPKRTSPRY